MVVEYPPAGFQLCDICVNVSDNPSVEFHEHGGQRLCAECLALRQSPLNRADLKRQWDDVLQNRRGARGYDFLLAYSGGADSTAALKLLVVKYRLKVLAFTIDNGMKHDPVWQNAMSVVRHLGADWLYINDVERATDVIVGGFRTEEPASCTMCNKGWRFPNYRRMMQQYDASCVLTGLEIPHGGSICGQQNPWLVKMMAAHMMSKKEIFDYIGDLPWKDPGIDQGFDTDCLGGGFGLELYRKKRGRHAPVVISFLSERIRYGLLDRSEELAKLNVPVREEHWVFLEDRFGKIRSAPTASCDSPRDVGQQV